MAVTDFSTIRDEIIERFNAEIETAEELQTQYPTAEFDRPNSGPWCELRIDQADQLQRSFGSPGNTRFDVEGQMVVRVFTPIGQGTKRQQDLIDVIKTAFESQTQNGIVWMSARGQEVGRVQNDWLFLVTIPFSAHIYQ